MKKKSFLGIIGCGILLGAAIYWVNKSINKDSVSKQNEDLLSEMDVSQEHTIEDTAVDFEAIKIQSAISMDDRHKAASQIINESLEKIYENSDLSSEHQEEFDSMLEELDKL